MMPAVSASAQESHHAITGIGLKLASGLCLASMAACVKALGPSVPAGQAVFFRGAISMLVIAAFSWRAEGLKVLKTKNWRAHAARSLAGALSMFCWFISLTLIPLAEMMAISFTIPLFLTVLAMVFLGEKIRWYRWTAIAVGLSGVLVMVGPDLLRGEGSALGDGVALMAAILAAFAIMFLRRMSGHEHALTITFYFFLTSSVLALMTLAFGPWPMPQGKQWLLLGMTGLFGVAGQLLLTYCYRYAEASLVAPLDYVNMIFAVAIGFYVFGEVPHVSIWVGAPLVIASGAIILWREYATLRRIRSAGAIDSRPLAPP
jgi:drug/metabolite transporter (DMT)-like permease